MGWTTRCAPEGTGCGRGSEKWQFGLIRTLAFPLPATIAHKEFPKYMSENVSEREAES